MLKVAMVGCGGIAHRHVQQIKAVPEIECVALCDIVPAKTALFKEKYFPAAQTFDSFDALLKSNLKIDAIIEITPHTVHYPHAKDALERGWHVLVEKPMVTSSEHAYDLWKTVKKSGKLLGIAYQSAYTETFKYLAESRDKGTLGKPYLFTGYLSQSWLKPCANSWRHDPSLSGGGQMYDSGAHLLNAVMWLQNDPVTEVACFYDTLGAPVDINGVAIAKFKNGAMASFTIGGDCPLFRTEITIQTDKMQIVTDQYGGKLEMTGKDGKRIYPHVAQELDHPGAGTSTLNFYRAIKGEEPLRAPARYGVLLSALMDAMYESAKTKTIVQVKPVPAEI